MKPKFTSCGYVQDVIKIVQAVLKSNHTLDDLFPVAEKLCGDVLKKYSFAEYMCPGLIFSYEPVVCITSTFKLSFICKEFMLFFAGSVCFNPKGLESEACV